MLLWDKLELDGTVDAGQYGQKLSYLMLLQKMMHLLRKLRPELLLPYP